jgi:PPOX class probable F420-dependent enzyme
VADLDTATRRRVAESPVARLATVRPDGHPHLVPITFALDGDRIVTAVDHKPKTTSSLQRLRNIATNPVASVLVDHYDDDWNRLWWVRGDGEARVVHDGVERDDGIDLLVAKYAPYREQRPEGPAVVVTVRHWASWSGGDGDASR